MVLSRLLLNGLSDFPHKYYWTRFVGQYTSQHNYDSHKNIIQISKWKTRNGLASIQCTFSVPLPETVGVKLISRGWFDYPLQVFVFHEAESQQRHWRNKDARRRLFSTASRVSRCHDPSQHGTRGEVALKPPNINFVPTRVQWTTS